MKRTDMQSHLVDPCVVHEQNTYAMTMVDLCVVCEKNTHPMTLGVVHENNTHPKNSGGSICVL